MVDKAIKLLLVFVPVTLLLEFMAMGHELIFISALLAIVPLAKVMGEATEVIASHTNPRLGGFLNATFGNATELILALVALSNGLTDMVKASVVGSVASNLLLVLGLSMLAGGFKYKTQTYSRKAIDFSITLLVLSAVLIALPTGFLNTTDTHLITGTSMGLSEVIAGGMILLYFAGLYFSFFTHKDIYGTDHAEVAEATDLGHGGGEGSMKKAILFLLGSTVLVAIMSEALVKSVETVSHSFGLSEFFIGLIIIPIIGNAAEHSAAVLMAVKNKMDIAIEIAVGSSIQILLFVFPVLIFAGLILGSPMSIIFNRYELVALAASIAIVAKVSGDGESNWLEGLILTLIYVIIALATLIVV